ncbi:MAG: HupE/UreJ family protein [Salibacteraceae bacterium]|nr:HupE/UreJ family protein [Salibacteraceae bacterium]
MTTYFLLGLNHVLDFSAFDHMLFICIMLLGLSLKDWKKMLVLVSAFTIGHSLTLAFVVLYQPILDTAIVEFLIPITIMLTAILKFFNSNKSNQTNGFIYATILFFGFIHGMGFANYLSILLPSGENLGQMLFMFNAGIEVAQLIIGSIFLGLIAVLNFISKQNTQIAQKSIAVVGVLISLLLAIQNFPF